MCYVTASSRAPIVNAWSTKSTLPFFGIGDYAPVFEELTRFDLPVEGAIPRERDGWYLIRSRPAKIGESRVHYWVVLCSRFVPKGYSLSGELAIVGSVCYAVVLAIALSTNVWINRQIARWQFRAIIRSCGPSDTPGRAEFSFLLADFPVSTLGSV